MLRVTLPVLLACTLAASAVHADATLYATAATTGEITSYCVGENGGLDPSPRQRIETRGNAPSRLVVARLPGGTFLYAAENDRVEVFRIGENGGLTLEGRIPARPLRGQPAAGLEGMNPHDLAVTENPPVLYVPQRRFDRIAAFPLDPSTGLSTVPTGFCTAAPSCSTDGQCVAGQSCVDGGCTCATTAECGDGQSCIEDRCVVVATCMDDGQCPAGQSCAEGVCTCTTDAGCGAGETCSEGICVATCDPGGVTTCAAPNPTCAGLSDQTGSSCVLGSVPAEWEDVDAASGLLYASRAVTRGEVLVYQLTPDGNFADGTVIVNRSIGGQQAAGCEPQRGCTTGRTCGQDTDCSPGPPDGRCVDGSCIDLQTTCSRNGDCAEGQTCEAFAKCDQDAKPYEVSSADCTQGVPLTDVDGDPIPGIEARRQIEPYARRRRLNGAGALVLNRNPVNGDLLYVSERFRRAISVFKLCPAAAVPGMPGEPPECPEASGEKGEPCTCPDENQDGQSDVTDLCPPGGFDVDAKFNKNGICTARHRQPRLNNKKGGRTFNDIRYNAMALAQGSGASSILAAQFLDGRIDGYRLKDDGRLPRGTTRRTARNFRTSPFQMFFYQPPASEDGVLFVGAGEIDRVQAYRLDTNGLPRDANPFAATERLKATFPNAVIVVEVNGTCPVP